MSKSEFDKFCQSDDGGEVLVNLMICISKIRAQHHEFTLEVVEFRNEFVKMMLRELIVFDDLIPHKPKPID